MIDPKLKQTLRATIVPLVTNLIERMISAIPENAPKEKATVTEKPAKVKKRKTSTSAVSADKSATSPATSTTKSKKSGKPTLPDFKIEKIHKGYGRNWSIQRIADFADVSKSSVVRYRPGNTTKR